MAKTKKTTTQPKQPTAAKQPDFNEWYKCPRCGSKNILVQKRGDTRTCRRCGASFTLDHNAARTVLIA